MILYYDFPEKEDYEFEITPDRFRNYIESQYSKSDFIDLIINFYWDKFDTEDKESIIEETDFNPSKPHESDYEAYDLFMDYIIDFEEELSNIFANWYNVIQVISFIILTMFYNIFQELTMKHLGPTHRIVIDGVFSILSIIFSFILNSTVLLIDFLLLQMFGQLCILIGIVSYNEIIIIKICGLDVNTNKQIVERATGADDKKMMVILPLYEKIDQF